VPRWYRGKFDPTPLSPYKYHPKGINHRGDWFFKTEDKKHSVLEKRERFERNRNR
jgi:hypothetical protein